MRRAWVLVLGLGVVGVVGCGDSDGNGDSVGTDGGKEDAGKPKKDSGPDEMDSGMDAGRIMDAGPDAIGPFADGRVRDALIMPVPEDSAVACIFVKPETWSCPDSFFDDGVCDCGCNGLDSCDCNQFSCTEPGCVEPTCGACNAADGTAMSCEPAPNPADWKCSGSPQSADGLCDCGCGIPDEACEGSGCSASGCYHPYCDRRWDTSGTPTQITSNPYTAGWQKCPLGEYGEGTPSSCDCGCGIHDADCDPLLDCTTPGCNAVYCNACHDVTGHVVPCADWVSAWTGNANNSAVCDPANYNAGDGVCDCGCGAIDPDCSPGAGTIGAAGSFAAECDRCFNTGNDQVGCDPPGAWTCDDQHYGTGDGCDCQCGAPDPDCEDDTGANEGCATADCSETEGTACEYCWDATPAPVQCGNGRWTCTSGDSVSAWTSTGTCDCGCGTPDPACRFNERPACTGPGCEVTGCEMCNDGAGGRTSCGGEWTANNCNLDYYGDGHCDCGCGAPDPDCGELGCTAKGCTAEGCEVCHQGSALIVCDTWHCDPADYDGADDVCDCGCGAYDPDCPAGYGCKEPGCHRSLSGTTTETCGACHDAFGRVVPCGT